MSFQASLLMSSLLMPVLSATFSSIFSVKSSQLLSSVSASSGVSACSPDVICSREYEFVIAVLCF